MDSLESLLRRMEELLHDVERLADTDRATVFELLDGIDTLHRHALTDLARQLDADTLASLRENSDAVAWLFDAYGVDVDERAAAEHALEQIRPYIHSHGGSVELLDVTDGVVRLRLAGACAGCTASAMTLSDGIEQALAEHLPGFARVEAEQEEAEPHPPPGPVLVELKSSPPEGWR
ncbi:NifU family protein [Haloechinothrix halophila]|uniref:NifU family protein n=1 Tax=Haloechinothrix halophila TaxID=1069073 RepID=UPI00040C34A4|nr:NifU family protein [Haloechinothrix halophila]